MSRDLTNLFIDETFQYLTQISGSNRDILEDGLGNRITELDITASNSVSSSYAVSATSSSYSNTSTSASHAIAADTSISSSYSSTASLLIGNATQVQSIDMEIGGVSQEQRLSWNDSDGTLDIGLKGGNVTLQVGQELVSRVVNKSGINLTEQGYQVVKVSGAQGQRLAVSLAIATSDANSADTLGVVTENIDNNQEGFITTTGLVRGIDTTGDLQGETWNEGDILYLSATTPGGLTNIKPVSPAHLVIIGYVVYKQGTQGTIYVKVDNGYELEELHDVLITNPVNGEALVYENGLWINSDVPHISASYAISSSQAETSNGVKNVASSGTSYILGGNVGDDTVLRTDLLISGGNAIQANGGFFGDLTGNANTATSASYALTASYALNAGGGGFPYTGSALITGSLGVTGSFAVESNAVPGNKMNFEFLDIPGLSQAGVGFIADATQFQSTGNMVFNTQLGGATDKSLAFQTKTLTFETEDDGAVTFDAGGDITLGTRGFGSVVLNPNRNFELNTAGFRNADLGLT